MRERERHSTRYSVGGGTYGVDGGQRQREVEVVAVVDVPVPHEPQVFISHDLKGAQIRGGGDDQFTSKSTVSVNNLISHLLSN